MDSGLALLIRLHVSGRQASILRDKAFGDEPAPVDFPEPGILAALLDEARRKVHRIIHGFRIDQMKGFFWAADIKNQAGSKTVIDFGYPHYSPSAIFLCYDRRSKYQTGKTDSLLMF